MPGEWDHENLKICSECVVHLLWMFYDFNYKVQAWPLMTNNKNNSYEHCAFSSITIQLLGSTSMHIYYQKEIRWKGILIDEGDQPKKQYHRIISTLHLAALKFRVRLLALQYICIKSKFMPCG